MLAVLLFLYGLGALAISSSSESGLSEIGDLGNLLLGGFVLAIGVAIALSFVRLRWREKKPPEAQFISISSVEKKR